MRLAQMCDAPGGWTKKHRSPSSRHELCRCAGEIHIFVKILGSKFWVGVTRHSQAIHFGLLDLFRLKGLQLMSITIERPRCPHG